MVDDPETDTFPDFAKLTDRQFTAFCKQIMPVVSEALYLYASLCEAGQQFGIGSEILLRVQRDPVLAADLALVIAGRATVERKDESSVDQSDGVCHLTDQEFARLLGYFCQPVSSLPIQAFAVHILEDCGIKTIGQLVQCPPEELMVLPGRGRGNKKRIGEATLRHLRTAFLEHGLRLGIVFSPHQARGFIEVLQRREGFALPKRFL